MIGAISCDKDNTLGVGGDLSQSDWNGAFGRSFDPLDRIRQAPGLSQSAATRRTILRVNGDDDPVRARTLRTQDRTEHQGEGSDFRKHRVRQIASRGWLACKYNRNFL